MTVSSKEYKAAQKAKNHAISKVVERIAGKHTEGPWRTHVKKPRKVMTKHGTVIATCPLKAKGNPNTLEQEPAEANAKLIAAAPDMLEALELALEWNFKGDYSDGIPEKYWAPEFKEFHNKLKAVIAKAKGLGE